MAENTRRQELEAAWDKVEKEEIDDIEVVDPPEKDEKVESEVKPEVVVEEEIDVAPDKKPVEKSKEKDRGSKKVADPDLAKEQKAAKDIEENKEPVGVKDKAPQSWKPIAREDWAKIPESARAEINRREAHIERTLNETAQVRRFATDFAQVINPFSHLIRAQNSTPLKAVHNLMSTAAGLMQGSAQQKAAIVAEIIGNYSVDMVELDRVLTDIAAKNGGRIPAAQNTQPSERIPSWAQPLFQMHQTIEQNRQTHEQTLRTNADAEIAQLESEPFFDDLRDDIADIMEIAAKKGKVMTLKQAYEKAIQLDDEISKIVGQRKEAEAVRKNKSISRARRAASTVSGGPSGKAAGNSSGDEKKSRREMLSEQWDEMS